MRYRAIALDYGGTLAHGDPRPDSLQQPVTEAAVAALRALHSLGLCLILVSNTLPHQDRRVALNAAGVADLFRVTFQSASLGVAKPDSLMLQLVIAAADCPPVQILSVGNHLDNDVRIPLAAGMGGVLVRRSGRVPEEELPRDAYMVREISALPDLVKEVS